MLLNKSRAHRIMAEQGIEALIATSPENVTYVSDYWSMAHWTRPGTQVYAVLPADSTIIPCVVMSTSALDLLADSEAWVTEAYRFGFFATEIASGKELSSIEKRLAALLAGTDHGDAVSALVYALKARKLDQARLAIDENGVEPAYLGRLRYELPGAEILPGARTFREIRSIKTPEEIARLRGAVHVTEQSIDAAFSIAREGVTELDLLEAFHKATISAAGFPVTCCIGTGARSALSNAQATARALRSGDVIRFDGGGRYKHYRADISRTGALGDPGEKVRRYYHALRAGMERAIAEIRPGVKAADIFKVAVETVQREGIPHYQRNHVGHGIGINNYDAPDLAPHSTEIIEEGMVLCVETPYYELGCVGLQVENTVVVGPEGAETLMSINNELRIL